MTPRKTLPSPRPRTKAKRCLAAVGGFAIVLLLAAVLVAYTGDPITKHLAMNVAETYANETYPDSDIKAVEASAQHWFRYEVLLESEQSADTFFSVYVACGKVTGDSYDETVGNCGNTWNRIMLQLTDDVDAALSAAGVSHAGYGLYHDNYLSNTGEVPVPAEGHPLLTVDMPYDKGNLPPVALTLDLEVPEETDDPQAAAWEFVQQVKSAMDAAGIDIAAYQVTFRGADASELYASPLIAAGDVPAAP